MIVILTKLNQFYIELNQNEVSFSYIFVLMIIARLDIKRELILKASLDLIYSLGLQGASISKIASHSNIAVGTIYYYFESKNKLILELSKYCRSKANAFILLKTDLEMEVREQIYALSNILIDFYITHAEIFSFAGQFYSSPYYIQMMEQNCTDTYGMDLIKNIFDKGVKKKLIREIEFTTFMYFFMGSIFSYVKINITNLAYIDKTNRNDLITMIWDGIKSTKCIKENSLN